MAVKRILPAQPERLKPDISLFIVNIVLLLILFFLATGQIMNGAPVDKRLALTQDLPLDLLPQPLLEVSAAGDLGLNGDVVTLTDLGPLLDGETELFVLIEGDVGASVLVDVLAAPDLADLNVELVTIATRSGSGG